jgi:hypothetical protein
VADKSRVARMRHDSLLPLVNVGCRVAGTLRWRPKDLHRYIRPSAIRANARVLRAERLPLRGNVEDFYAVGDDRVIHAKVLLGP